MSRKIKVAISSMIILAMTSVSAFASVNPFADIVVDYDSLTIKYSGVSGSLPVRVVNAVVVQGFDTAPYYNNTGTNVCGIDSVLTEEGGAYSGSIILSPTTPAGNYEVYVDSENGHASKKFIVISEAASASFLASLNGTAYKSAFSTYFETNAAYFGVVSADYSASCRSFAEGVMFAQKQRDGGYASAKAVYKAFNKAAAIFDIKTETDTDATIKYHAAILDIDYDEYSALASKSALNTLLKSADYEAADFGEVYEKNLIYAEIKSASNYTAQRDKISEYSARMQNLGFAFPTNFNAVVNKDAVYQELFRERNNISKFEDLAVKLSEAVDKIYSEEHNPNSVNNAGGNGGGGGGGGFGGGDLGGFVNTNPAATVGQSGKLSDVSNHWANKYIDKLVKSGGISGYEDGTFKPDNTITRAEFTKIIVSVFGLSGDGGLGYGDVSEDAWYSNYIEKAAANGIIYGSDGMFFPNNNITRQDAALIIYRILAMKNITMSDGSEFSDQSSISDYAKDAVSKMSGIGIINGYEGNFMPNNNITRAEAATIIALAMDLM
ncbi:MAG: S-layer homology domain-containing protein [Firmicutes bacterium]|nr:S-layer homology domain-containing protein [Bacillota bacterium]